MSLNARRLNNRFGGLLAGMLLCGAVSAQSVGTTSTTTAPPSLTELTLSSPFINIGGSPQNIFVTAVPSGASVANCSITAPTTALATYNPTFLLGPTITVSPSATGTTQAVQHTFTCGSVTKTFVVKPPTYPADILLSGTELQVGSTTTQHLFVTASPAGTVLPSCTITSTPALAAVSVDALLGTKVTLTPSAAAITANATQTVTCGSLSKTFTVKPKVITSPVFSATPTGTITNLMLKGSFVLPTADQGKQGAVFVAAILQGNVFFQNASGGWAIYLGGAAPSVFTGTLTDREIDIISTPADLSGLRGAQILIGYGLGTIDLNAFNNMLNNGTYGVSYTIN